MINKTQLHLARAGIVSDAMRAVAEQERRTPDYIMREVAAGRIVIPANFSHTSLRPIGIGRVLKTKINANIGNSSMHSEADSELRKLQTALEYGADTVMDLSTGKGIRHIRQLIMERSPAPIGTVPLYQAAAELEDIRQLTPQTLLSVIAEQAAQGVDYMTIHAGLLREHLDAAAGRLLGIVSRGGALTASWMKQHQMENPAYSHFDKILDICRQHDVTLSLGDGLRPGCLADASDAAQFAELSVLGELARRCREAEVQVMIEGPGHIPLDEIKMNMERERELCDDAPFYILGPVVADCAPGYDHITAAIGGAVGAAHGAAMICYVTPREHLGLPNDQDVREGVIACKIAAHAADIAKKVPGSRERDDQISQARADFDWQRQFSLALDPERARQMHREALEQSRNQGREEKQNKENENSPPARDNGTEESQDYCTMCGPNFCSMRVSRETLGNKSTKLDPAQTPEESERQQ